jgi:UDP-N-acetylmuramate: L-alanyl-gamma-D-glutamyl-meso-diaminopimelate ligase
LGAAVLLLNLKAVSSKQLGKAVFSFKPLARRLDKKTSRTSVPLYEGFGSSREKAKAAIEAVKLHFPKKKLLIVFEPHTFSWRSRSALKWYDDVFDGSEKVFIYKPPEINPARNQLNLKEIIRRVENAGIGVVGFDEISGGLSLIKKQVGRDNMILILTSGGFDGFLESLIPWLERKFPIQ